MCVSDLLSVQTFRHLFCHTRACVTKHSLLNVEYTTTLIGSQCDHSIIGTAFLQGALSDILGIVMPFFHSRQLFIL